MLFALSEDKVMLAGAKGGFSKVYYYSGAGLVSSFGSAFF